MSQDIFLQLMDVAGKFHDVENIAGEMDELAKKYAGGIIQHGDLKNHIQKALKIWGIDYDTSQFGKNDIKAVQDHLRSSVTGKSNRVRNEKSGSAFYQTFTLLGKNCMPLKEIYYTAELESNILIHGVTDRQGATACYITAKAEKIKIYGGHNTKGMKDRYLIGESVTKQDENASATLYCDKFSSKEMKVSEAGKDFVKDWESIKTNGDGTLSFYYDDSAGYCTVGWGELVSGKSSCKSQGKKGFPNELSYKSGDEKKYDHITVDAAKALFNKSIKIKAEDVVGRSIKSPLSQHEFDALCSLIFNIGSFSPAPKLLKLINNGNYVDGPKEMLDINKAKGKAKKGLTTRRNSEYEMFVSGIYDSSH